MITQIYKTTSKRFYLIEREGVFDFGYLKKGNVLTTGKPYLRNYLTEEELKNKVDSIKGDGFYDESLTENI
tara:strand:- start:43 stop:255 length:213 start_codon:yes stop_codon:yes gene_type:complete